MYPWDYLVMHGSRLLHVAGTASLVGKKHDEIS
jgi:hypothetical protein